MENDFFKIVNKHTYLILFFLYKYPQNSYITVLHKKFNVSQFEKKIKWLNNNGFIKTEKKQISKNKLIRYFFLTNKGIEIIENLIKISEIMNNKKENINFYFN